MWGNAMLNSMRKSAMTRNTPTPSATEKISVLFGMDGTCSANTWRSGSEIVMMNPSTNPSITMMLSFFLLVTAVPSRSPMGVMLISAPSVKNMVPMTIMAAPIRKHSKILEEMGAIVKHRTMTLSLIHI